MSGSTAVGDRPLRESEERSLPADARAPTSGLRPETRGGRGRQTRSRPKFRSRSEWAEGTTPSPEAEGPSRSPAALGCARGACLRIRRARPGHSDQRHRLSGGTCPRRDPGRSCARATGAQRRSWRAGRRHEPGSAQACRTKPRGAGGDFPLSRRAKERLADIAEAINRIRGYVGDLEGASIDLPVVADAVVYNLLVIGEQSRTSATRFAQETPRSPGLISPECAICSRMSTSVSIPRSSSGPFAQTLSTSIGRLLA
jgi:hypothetical protein